MRATCVMGKINEEEDEENDDDDDKSMDEGCCHHHPSVAGPIRDPARSPTCPAPAVDGPSCPAPMVRRPVRVEAS